MGLRLAVDVGGTFTDGVLLDDTSGRIWLAKSLTTYADPGDAIATVSESLLSQYGKAEDVTQLVHGTTLITNTLLERKGVRTALITNDGLEDVLDIRRELRFDTYDLAIGFPQPLAAPEDRVTVSARLGPDGTEWQPVDDDQLFMVVKKVAESGVAAVAVCLLHAPVSDRHEQTVRNAVKMVAPNLPVSISSEVAAELGEYERMSTTVANAYVQPIVEQYMQVLKSRFEAQGIPARLDVMVSNGGFTTAQQAARFPIRLLESGPAGGVLSAINCAAVHETHHVLAFDMGGTTAKSCVAVDGVPDLTHVFEFAREKRFKKGSGLPAVAPSIDLIEIGAGGGSIARRNALGLLQVGPDSAGSEPGPACYGLGGEEPTVTDSDLVLGYLDPEGFLGGAMQLSTAKAHAALARAGAQVGLDAEETAWGVHDIVNENMASAARTHIAEKGLDARRFTMVATGGAGPVHAVDVARRLRIRRILCPIASGVGSCLGFLAAPARGDRTWSRVERADLLDGATLLERIRQAHDEIKDELVETGIDAGCIRWECAAEMRYLGQGARLEVKIDDPEMVTPASLSDGFLRAYEMDFGRTVPGGVPEVVTWRVWGVAGEEVRHYRLGNASITGEEAETRRPIYVPGKKSYEEVTVYVRKALQQGTRLRAPCIVTEAESTLVIAHDADVAILDDGTIEVMLDEVAS